jgi:hypothetical protein
MVFYQRIAAAVFALAIGALGAFMSMSPPEFTGARYALAFGTASLITAYVFWVISAADNRSITTQLFFGLVVAGIGVFGVVYGYQWIDYRQKSFPITPFYAGILKPDKLIEGERVNEVKIQIGNSTVFLSDAKVIDDVLRAWSNDHFIVEMHNGDVLVSTKIRDDHGNVVGELNKNEWKVAPFPGTWDRNYTNDRLEIIDQRGNVVLQVRVLPGTVQIQGVWQVTISGVLTHFVLAEIPGGATVATCPVIEQCRAKIQPIFRYPSERHLGELL